MPKNIDVLPDFTPGEIRFKPIPLFTYRGSLRDELAAGLTPEQVKRMLRYMLTIRYFERMIVDLRAGKYEALPDFKFVGATHLSIGQEAVAVGAISAINADDYITSTHRGHGHAIAKGAYAIEVMEPKRLAEYWGLDPDDPELREKAFRKHVTATIAELFGKEEGYCHGRGGGMHIADFNVGHLGANAIVGGSYGIATGAAMACEKLGNGRIVLCFMGDGAQNNGICHEAYNFATMSQFKNGTPVIYLVENNQYGMTGQQVGEVTGVRYLAQRAAGYNDVNMHAEVVNGMDVFAVRDAVSRAAEKCRNKQGPVMLECLTYRYMGHSLSDQRTSYRSEREEQAWRALDPIEQLKNALLAENVMTAEEIAKLERETDELMKQCAVEASQMTDPDPKDIYVGLFADTTSDDISPEWRTPESELLSPPPKPRRDHEGRLMYRHAVAEALMEEMLRDRRVIVYGEDVADYGGAFMATRGLLEVFGRERVFNTAISEACICGTGVGAAMVGMRPVVEIMYIDFILMAMDQVGNQAAKARYMFGGKATIPLVIRTTIGGGRGYAGQHSQSLEAVVTMIPGLKVVAPSTAYDVKGLLKTAIRDDNVVIFIEHQNLYTTRDPVPLEEYTIPLGKGVVRREGSDITVVAYSAMVPVALQAAEMVHEEHGISVEVVDPRTLIPLDEELINNSVRKTGRLMVVTQAPRTGCFGEHIVYVAQRDCFDALKGPTRIVAAHDVPPPMAPTLERENIPSPEKVARNIVEMCRA